MPKRHFQFTLRQLMLTVALSALVFSVPPVLWLVGISITIGLLAMSLAAGLMLLIVVGPTLMYWNIVHRIESRRPSATLPDIVFAIFGTACFFLGLALFIGVMLLLMSI